MLPASSPDSTLGKQAASAGVNGETGDGVTMKESKRNKQQTRKGQRLDLRLLPQGQADETRKTYNGDQHEEIEQEMAGLGIRSNELPTTKRYPVLSERSSIFILTPEPHIPSNQLTKTKPLRMPPMMKPLPRLLPW
jgi:hypothetical protein